MSSCLSRDIIALVLSQKAHQDILLPRSHFERLPDLEAHRSVWGDHDGQIADYRYTQPDGRDIHIKEYPGAYWKVHWDYASPSANPIGHLLDDAPHWFFMLAGAAIIAASARR